MRDMAWRVFFMVMGFGLGLWAYGLLEHPYDRTAWNAGAHQAYFGNCADKTESRSPCQ